MAPQSLQWIGRGDSDQPAEHQFGQPSLAEPVGAHQRVDGHAMLGQAPGILERRRGSGDAINRDVVLQRVQFGGDVSLDAGIE
jgi:hypothetical protein